MNENDKRRIIDAAWILNQYRYEIKKLLATDNNLRFTESDLYTVLEAFDALEYMI